MPRDYLIQYGASAYIGKFQSPEGDYVRGEEVEIQTPRGRERGTVLCIAESRFSEGVTVQRDGTILGLTSLTNVRQVHSIADILASAEQFLVDAQLPAAVLDLEVLADGHRYILHATIWGECDLNPVLGKLEKQFDCTIQLQPLFATSQKTQTLEEESGCGKPGCGSSNGGCSTGSCGTSGGCSTGSCSRGAVKNSSELTEQFLKLREAMEQQASGRRNLT
jgi:hypothetical protein